MIQRPALCLMAFLAAGLASPSHARNAIAFAQAPEMSSGMCAGKSIAEAQNCATRQCIEGGGTEEDCLLTAACFPAGWTVDIFVQQQDGPHWHEVHCGFDSAETAVEAAGAICNRERRSDLIECSVTRLLDEDGTEHEPPAGR